MNEFSYFTKALDEVFESELDDYITSIDTDVACDLSEKNSRKIKKLIKRREKPYYALISTGARRAACIAVAVIVLSASALSVKAVRKAVYDFIIRFFPNHVEVTTNTDPDYQYPKTLEDEYYISDMPEGFELVDHSADSGSVYSAYFRDDDYIVFEQYTKDSYINNYDIEHSEQYTLEEDGQEYLIFDTGDDYTVVWDNGKYILEISSNFDKDTILQLFKSTKLKLM